MPSFAPMPHEFRPTSDLTATFGEHEELKTILRAGMTQFDIKTVCEASTRRAPYPAFPVVTASMGSRDPLAPAVGGDYSAIPAPNPGALSP